MCVCIYLVETEDDDQWTHSVHGEAGHLVQVQSSEMSAANWPQTVSSHCLVITELGTHEIQNKTKATIFSFFEKHEKI